MSHDLRSTIVFLNIIFKSTEVQIEKENKIHFVINLAKDKIMKISTQIIYIYIYIYIMEVLF
jgi:hypothetical protein